MKKSLIVAFLIFYLFVILLMEYFFSDRESLILIIAFSFIMSVVLIGFLIHFLYKRIINKINFLEKGINSNYSQIEAMFSIFSILKINKPLPTFRGWAISPDFTTILMNQILEQKPDHILECGSGVSTLIISYLLKDKAWGNLLSLEHDEKYAMTTRELLISHDISGKSTILTSELIDYNIKNENWKWYDIAKLDPDIRFDLLIIDGPPSNTNLKARYPALQLLDSHLNKGAVIIIDDSRRVEDHNIVKMWLSEFENYSKNWYNTEKGTFRLVKLK